MFKIKFTKKITEQQISSFIDSKNQKKYYFHLSGNQDNIMIKITDQEQYDFNSKILGSIQVLKMKKEAKDFAPNSKPYGVKWIKLENELQGKGVAVQLQKLAMTKAKEYGATHYCSDNRRSPAGEKFWTRNNIEFHDASKRFCLNLQNLTVDQVKTLKLNE